MSKSVKKGLLAVGVLAPIGAFADDAANMAALTGGFAVNVDPVFIVAGIIMVGIGSIWSIKKVIALGNKS